MPPPLHCPLSNGSLVENVVTIVSKSFDDDQDITFTIGADALGLGVGNPIDVPFGMVSREPHRCPFWHGGSLHYYTNNNMDR